MTHPIVELAKRAVEEHVKHGKTIQPPETLTPEMKERAGVFVCIKKHGRLRGCIGTFMPLFRNVAEEAIRNAIGASSEDPRFPHVSKEELPDLVYSVDVLSAPEKVDDIKKLDPKKYGVIVESNRRKGLLLPDLEGVDTVEEQIGIARMKAGIPLLEDIDIYRFEVRRYG